LDGVKNPEDDKLKEEEKKEVEAFKLELKTISLEESKRDMYDIDALIHNFYIVKEVGSDINWKKPLIQEKTVETTVALTTKPFSEGAMRYAFYMEDYSTKSQSVAKVNKD
jgi:hypothetical protein